MPALGRWFLLLTPVAAGLLYGPLIHRFAREARGHGVPEVMYAVAETGGRIRPQVAAVKALASAICIGGGGSVGREGPIVQIGSALGSAVGQVARLPAARMRILVACGAAGGIAATFNAPLAGVFFALELILADFAVESFAAVVLSAVAASVVGRAILGDHPFLTLPAFTVTHPDQFLGFAALGVAAAGAGVLFSRLLYAIEDVCDRLWRGPQWLRPAAGGLLLGALLLVLPQMYGVGYPVLGSAAAGAYTVTFLLVLLLAKILATSLTIGIGGSGGVFAPSLFIGAMLGAATGQILHIADPALAPAPGAYALVGMGAVFAGAARTPITAVLIMFELTGQYRIILPLMLAIAVAAGLSRLLSPDTIYTRKLTRRGVDLLSPTRRLRQTSIAVAAGPLPEPIPPEANVAAVAARFAAGTADTLPVRDGAGHIVGVITAEDVEQVLAAADVTAAQLARPVPSLAADADLESAMTQLARHHVGGLPVVTADRPPITWVTHHDLLRAAAAIGRPAPHRRPAAATPAEA
ncbi:chloride channel protein [Hamadaea sp. NPDC050747]|uniref:chloride channel protein n=1 Tax=Hamadaea sp. NPDC050747 TaxID=3155789 RepID=UPI0033FEBBEB